MVSKPHRTNSAFQLLHFMAGDCKTPDGAWSLLYGQKIDMEVKVAHSDAQRLRREATIADAEDVLATEDLARSKYMIAKADIIEANAGLHVWELNLQAAKDELADIEQLMLELEPLRKYSHLGILEASEACQQEEWLLELMSRAENHLTTHGTIPAEELRFMRNHPEFEKRIIPHIQLLTERLQKLSSATEGLKLLATSFVTQLPSAKISNDTKLRLA